MIRVTRRPIWQEAPQRIRRGGYLSISDRETTVCVHRLVAEAFIGPCPLGKQVNHRNGLKADNSVGNLEYVTSRENNLHALRTGLRTGNRGERNGNAKLSNASVAEVRKCAASGESRLSLAARMGVSLSVIRRVINRQIWRHVA